MRCKPKNKGDVDKLAQALQKMGHEDLTMKVVNDGENRQTLIYGIGEMQIDVIASKLKDQYNIEIELSDPKVAYKETVKKKSDVEYKYKNVKYTKNQ